jgi:hypothetical protein
MTEIKHIEGSLIGNTYKPHMEFRFSVVIPCVETERLGLVIEHDGPNDATIGSMLALAEEGKAPYCVCVGVYPADLLLPGDEKRCMRMNNYDLFDREYGDFLVYELVPYIEDTYGVHIDPSPDMHCVSGGSSGGISAFTIAWFHPEYFRRVYMSSPSFLAMGRGNEIPYLIRKYETKPIRIYEEYSENEPNDYFGWSRGIDEEAREALTFANYDFRCVSFANEGHCSRYHNEAEAYKRNAWIWQDWQSKQITAPNNSPRVQKVIPVGSRWEPYERFPAAEQPVSPRLADIYTKVVRSNDDRMWYAGSEQDDIVYAHVVGKEASPDQRILHATLHTIPRQGVKGPIDMTVDRTDRLYVLTEIGIQCVRSYGLIDVILDLPDGGRPQKIAVTDGLYVQTDRGIYRRALCEACITPTEEKRKQISYYD